MCDSLKCFHQLDCQRSCSFTQPFTQPQYNILSLCFGRHYHCHVLCSEEVADLRDQTENQSERPDTNPLFISDEKYNPSLMHTHFGM